MGDQENIKPKGKGTISIDGKPIVEMDVPELRVVKAPLSKDTERKEK